MSSTGDLDSNVWLLIKIKKISFSDTQHFIQKQRNLIHFVTNQVMRELAKVKFDKLILAYCVKVKGRRGATCIDHSKTAHYYQWKNYNGL